MTEFTRLAATTRTAGALEEAAVDYVAITNLGAMPVRPFDVAVDAAPVHAWVTSGRAPYWDMETATLAEVEKQYADMVAAPDKQPWMGYRNGDALFLVETYELPTSPLADLCDHQPGDVGFHFLLQRSDTRIPGLSAAAFGAALAFTLEYCGAARVVVEPDYRNDAVRHLNRQAGFTEIGKVSLPDKTAMLSVCAAADFWVSDLARAVMVRDDASPAPNHGTPRGPEGPIDGVASAAHGGQV